jgi:hypothetical protein
MMVTACNSQQKASPEGKSSGNAPSAEPATGSAATEQPAPGAGEGAGIENPVVESTPEEITDKLGVEFKVPEQYAGGAKYSLVGDNVAQMEYAMDGDKGPINVTYRVSKTGTDDALTISGDNNVYETSEKVTLANDQQVLVRYGKSAGPGSCLWYNPNVVGGGVSASILMDPVENKDQLAEVATFFVDQESKGF